MRCQCSCNSKLRESLSAELDIRGIGRRCGLRQRSQGNLLTEGPLGQSPHPNLPCATRHTRSRSRHYSVPSLFRIEQLTLPTAVRHRHAGGILMRITGHISQPIEPSLPARNILHYRNGNPGKICNLSLRRRGSFKNILCNLHNLLIGNAFARLQENRIESMQLTYRVLPNTAISTAWIFN